MSARSFTKQNLRFLVNIHPRGETEIAELVGRPVTQQKISSVFHGKYLKPNEVHAIELKFGIPDGWLHDYPIEKAWKHLRRIQQMSLEDKKAVHGLLQFASDLLRQKTSTP